MKIVKLEDCKQIVAGDSTLLKEILCPYKDQLDIRYSLAHAIIPAGKSSYLHSLTTSEVFYIISGRGKMNINEEVENVGPGDTVYIPPNGKQYLTNTGTEDLVFIAIVDPAWKKENETVSD